MNQTFDESDLLSMPLWIIAPIYPSSRSTRSYMIT